MKQFLQLVFVGIFSLVLVETILRLVGFEPAFNFSSLGPGKELTAQNQFDAELGWVSKPGKYRYALSSGREYGVNILPDHSRRSSPDKSPDSESVIAFFGGSYLFGFNLSDPQTFSWKMQNQRKASQIKNFAVSGYGTLQSLMLFEKYFSKTEDLAGRTIVYGFIPHHLQRNISDNSWRMLLANNSLGNSNPPYCGTITQGKCQRVIGEFFYPRTFLGRYSAFVHLLEVIYGRAKPSSQLNSLEVAEALLNEFKTTVEQRGGRFAVMLLAGSEEEISPLFKGLAKSKIKTLDCRPPPDKLEQYRLPEDSHPNEKLNEYWLGCLGSI